jgi:Uma2 family endonuclease
MTTATRLMTAEQLQLMPDDGYRYELIRGEQKKMSPAGSYHGILTASVTGSLIVHVRVNNLGKVLTGDPGFLISSDPDTVRAPDAAFISRERLEETGETDGYWPGAPDLVVEVISPNDRYTEVEEKVAEWLEAGARMVVVVNPRRRSVRVHRSLSDVIDLTEGDVIDGANVVPGWTLPISEIFED